MLRRALLMVFSINEDHGFLYTRRYSADEIAADIVAYVLERRTAPVQNVIYHTSELLNLESITAEVYYGPQPSIPPGEELELAWPFPLRPQRRQLCSGGSSFHSP